MKTNNATPNGPENKQTKLLGTCRNISLPDLGHDLSGDFSGGSFLGAEIDGRKRRRGGKATLDGAFVGADFRVAKISHAILSGDFSGAQFAGAELQSCELLGKFDGATDLGPAMHSCIVHPSASFKGADLRGIPEALPEEILVTETQIENARISFFDRIPVKTGQVIKLLGKEFGLLRPAQSTKSVVISDCPSGSCQAEEGFLDISRINNVIRQTQPGVAPFLFDVAGLTKELHGQSRYRESKWIRDAYYLHAPSVTLRGFQAGQNGLNLAGNFAQASLKDSQIDVLRLEWGSFAGFDMAQAEIKKLLLNLDRIDFDGLEFSDSVTTVQFGWRPGKRPNIFASNAAIAKQVLKSWNSASACEALAENILDQSAERIDSKKILASGGKTIEGVAGTRVGYSTDLTVCCALIARRNQLKGKASRRIMGRQKPHSHRPSGTAP